MTMRPPMEEKRMSMLALPKTLSSTFWSSKPCSLKTSFMWKLMEPMEPMREQREPAMEARRRV